MSSLNSALIMTILEGCFALTCLAIGVGCAAVLLDYIVRFLEKRGVSKSLCQLLTYLAMALVALDAALVVAWAVWEFVELLPAFQHLHQASR